MINILCGLTSASVSEFNFKYGPCKYLLKPFVTSSFNASLKPNSPKSCPTYELLGCASKPDLDATAGNTFHFVKFDLLFIFCH